MLVDACTKHGDALTCHIKGLTRIASEAASHSRPAVFPAEFTVLVAVGGAVHQPRATK